LRLDLPDRILGASFHATRSTLNLVPDRVFGAELVAWVESRLRTAVGDTPVVGDAPAEGSTVRAGRARSVT